jgi:hypothetical protein
MMETLTCTFSFPRGLGLSRWPGGRWQSSDGINFNALQKQIGLPLRPVGDGLKANGSYVRCSTYPIPDRSVGRTLLSVLSGHTSGGSTKVGSWCHVRLVRQSYPIGQLEACSYGGALCFVPGAKFHLLRFETRTSQCPCPPPSPPPCPPFP